MEGAGRGSSGRGGGGWMRVRRIAGMVRIYAKKLLEVA